MRSRSELAMPRETFVLMRGQYDQPDAERPVVRNVPAALGAWPTEAPRDRRGLAQWLVPHTKLMSHAMDVAEHIASAPTFATQMAKESLNRGLDIPNLEDASWVDAYRFMALSLTDETKRRHDEWRARKA